ncbi:MAG: N-acetylmuramoyl-L-alanine amidase [Chloroflexi bacterium]|nr:N-acetylmuramoyl-L-alanine amidase [Chloroflexota bacterium]MBI3733203.1 N-acetylmuramoyl-L-alanine amidase [Chloroflexota bacterium]
MIKEPPMVIDGRVMQQKDFVAYVMAKEFGPEPPTAIFLHHTWRPAQHDWQGLDTLLAMKAYYEHQSWVDEAGQAHSGWTAGPHLFIAEDGIWLFSDMAYDGVGVVGHNHLSLHIEMVGDFDSDPPSGKTWANTVTALGALHARLGLETKSLMFHRDFSSKTCPGNAVTKEWVIPQVEAWVREFRQYEALRNAVMDQARRLFYANINPEAALYRVSQARGLLGPLSDEWTVDANSQHYIVQFFVDALVVPVGQWKQVKRLSEVSDVTHSPPPGGAGAGSGSVTPADSE